MTRASTLRLGAVFCSLVLTAASHAWSSASLLAFVALVPWLWALRSSSFWGRTFLGFVHGLGVTALLSDGIVHALHFHLDVARPLAWLLIGGIYGALLGLFSGVFGALYGPFVLRSPAVLRPWCTAALFACVEWLRAHAFIGFPFALLGHTQHRQLSLIQVADLGGVYAVSFVLVLVNAALNEELSRTLHDRARVVVWSSVSACLVACLLYGQWCLVAYGEPQDTVRVGLINPDASQGANEDPAVRNMLLWRAIDASVYARDHGASLLVWPETALYGTVDRRVPWRIEYALGSEIDLLVGGVHADPLRADPRKNNSAFLVRNGRVLSRYDKQKLFPIGEYDPGRGVPWLEGKLPTLSDLLSGEGPGLVRARVGTLGVLICFEGLYSHLAREAVRAGAEMLVVIANDAWFGDTRTNRLSAAMVSFRAVETRRFLLRSANRGATGVVSPTGVSSLDFDVGPQRVAIASAAPRTGLTFYARFGNVFCLLCAGGLAAAWAGAWHARRSAQVLSDTK